MRKGLIAIVITIWILSVGAGNKGTVDTSYMETMYTTAYYMGTVTATGVPVHPGVAACNTHVGDVAIIYSMGGKYLGTYEVCDVGATEGLKAGRVIDVWKSNYTMCEGWMKLVAKDGGRVKVLWIEGKG